uniref:Uncharacterized protein n=1 Tax=Lepeophtheirus salmonis TaxID=72036 RepID=A0A0K2TPW1_LEPSM
MTIINIGRYEYNIISYYLVSYIDCTMYVFMITPTKIVKASFISTYLSWAYKFHYKKGLICLEWLTLLLLIY